MCILNRVQYKHIVGAHVCHMKTYMNDWKEGTQKKG